MAMSPRLLRPRATTAATPYVPQPPAAPTGVAVAGGDSSLSIVWTAPYSDLAITGYVVEYTPAGGSATTRSTSGSATVYLLTFLTNGTAYTVRVAAVSAAGTGPYSSASSPATPATTPGAPTSLAATAGNAQVALSWAAPASNGGATITDYAAQFSSNGGSTWTTFADGTSTATSATVTGLTNGTAYVFRVAATNAAGTGNYSGTASGTPISVALTVSPTTIVGQIGGGSAVFTFSGDGTASSKLSTGGTYRQNRFAITTIDDHSFTCGASGTLFFEWSTEDNGDGGEDIFSMAGYTKNGVASTSFAGSQTNISGTSKRGISVSSGDVIVWTTKGGLATYAWTPLRAWIE